MKTLLLFLLIILINSSVYAKMPQPASKLSAEQLEKIKQFQIEHSKKVAPFIDKYQDDDIIFLVGKDKILFKDIKIGYQNSLKHHLEFYKDQPLDNDIAKSYFDKVAGGMIVKTLLLQEVEKQKLYPLEEALDAKFIEFKNKIENSQYKQLI